MTINFEKTILNQLLNKQYLQPRRAQIYVGFQCHQGCGFCYYHNKCTEKMFDFEQIKRQIDFEYDYGIRDFEITGGEPSESVLLRDVCQYIKEKDNTSKIAIITNGSLFNYNIWDLIDEVLVSYHLGKNDQYYDKTIFPNGNTFNKVFATITNARKHNILVRMNTVLGTFNLNNIDSILNDILVLAPDVINFLPVNLFDQATSMKNYIDYKLLRPKLKNIIDLLTTKLPKTEIFVRYIPFCDMEGYERYIVGHLQHIYDWFDWNRELDGAEVITMANNKCDSLLKLGEYGSTSVMNVIQTRNMLYHKNNKCLNCKYNVICDGVEKTYNNVLEKFIVPSVGKLIKDPLFFIKNRSEILYYTHYNK